MRKTSSSTSGNGSAGGCAASLHEFSAVTINQAAVMSCNCPAISAATNRLREIHTNLYLALLRLVDIPNNTGLVGLPSQTKEGCGVSVASLPPCNTVQRQMAERVSDYQEVGQRLKLAALELRNESETKSHDVNFQSSNHNYFKLFNKLGITLKLIGQAENELSASLVRSLLSDISKQLEACELVNSNSSKTSIVFPSNETANSKHKGSKSASNRPTINEHTTSQCEALTGSWKNLAGHELTNVARYQAFINHKVDFHERAVRYLSDARRTLEKECRLNHDPDRSCEGDASP